MILMGLELHHTPVMTPEIMQALDRMLASFVDQARMKLPGPTYNPCYKVVS